jgi:hypothetical protein
MMDFYTKTCFEISGKPANLQKLVDIHDACVKAQRNLSEPRTDLVRLVFPEWTGEDDYINPESVTVRIVEDAEPYAVIDGCDGYADIDPVEFLEDRGIIKKPVLPHFR